MKKWKFALVSIFVIAFVGNVYFWNWQYATGIRSNYDSGFLTGRNVGYQIGYDEGNQTGYQIGYLGGYENGNSSGYQRGYEDGEEAGYIQGVEDGAGRGYTIRDPTFSEALDFISLDQTDKNEYSEDYICFNFAADFKNNSFCAGYRCGFVRVEFADSVHAIVCFNTIDEGVKFIEPQTDDIMTPTIGEPYWDRTIWSPPEYDDTIVSFDIIW